MRETSREYWSKLIGEQEASGQTVREFCRERGRGVYSFYRWRKRLREDGAVRFALVETRPTAGTRGDATLELGEH